MFRKSLLYLGYLLSYFEKVDCSVTIAIMAIAYSKMAVMGLLKPLEVAKLKTKKNTIRTDGMNCCRY